MAKDIIKQSPQLTQSYLKKLLDYNPKTGIFIWRKRKDSSQKWNTRYAGKVAGCDKEGYITIGINNRQIYAHRLVFMWMIGEFPEEVDHQDMNRSNNKWENLRAADRAKNQRNKHAYKNNTSGVKGIRFCKERRKWCATITYQWKQKNLGRYSTKEAASAAYAEAAIKYFGEFARTE